MAFTEIKRSANIMKEILTHYIRNTSYGRPSTISEKVVQLKSLVDVLSEYGGILAKVSQLVSIDNSGADYYCDCKPYSREQTHDNFVLMVEQDVELFKNIISIDYNIFKSGSIGQVYKAVYRAPADDTYTDIVIKTQYSGLRSQFDNDLKLLCMISSFLYNFISADVENDIINKLYEELDYEKEASHQIKQVEIWNNRDDIIIPGVIPELSNKQIISSEFVDSVNLHTFIENSTQPQRNNIGRLITEYVFAGIFIHNLFYCDIHYGNFSVVDNDKLCVMDFGCIIPIEDDLRKNLVSLYESILADDKPTFYQAISNMGIISEFKNEDAKEYIYSFFKSQFEPLTNPNFVFNNDWLTLVNTKDQSFTDDWILPKNCTFLNKIYHGLYQLLESLTVDCDLHNLFHNIICISKELN